ncbi:MAG: hypothetical protein OIF55_06265 [Amphritea sp.]|nr:hypothetical protein [Amphritea sp.]
MSSSFEMTGCPFCLNDDLNISFDDSFPVHERILREYKSFYVIPTLGALEEGHVLIVSKRHVSGLPDFYYEEKEELKIILSEWMRLLEFVYRRKVGFFQHGVSSCTGNGCVDHFHLHVLPQKVDLYSLVKAKITVKDVNDLSDVIEPGDYICVGNNESCIGVAYLDVVPSQFVRKLYALNVSDLSDWNWRAVKNQEKMKKTYVDLMGLL